MVIDDTLKSLVQQQLGPSRKSILVTGGAGFVGSRLAEVLVESGHDVTVSGRSRWRVRSRGKFVAADMADWEQVESLCSQQDIVFHCAALTSPWGSLAQHRRENVQGTKNVVAGCVKHSVDRLVHVSSTAILFEFQDRTDIPDDAPLPQSFCNPYAQSKAEAEAVVQDAIAAGLSAWIVRARAVFGPGDSVLLPRLIEAAERGKLRQIGDGRNICDLTYVDNLVAGLILAAGTPNRSGRCTITNHEPIVLWPLLKKVIHEVTGKELTGKVPRSLALKAASLVELKHRWLRSPGEPPITRYAAGLLSHEQTFQSATATDVLGYEPLISMQQGIDRTIKFLSSSGAVTQTANVASIRFFTTGYIEFSRRLAQRGAAQKKTRFHATVALIDHPKFGLTLFDTGYSPRFNAATQKWPWRLYRMMTPAFVPPELAVVNQLKASGVDPSEIRQIVISHFHADHICGLSDFPNADFVATNRAWEGVKHLKGLRAIKNAFIPSLLPDDFSDRFHGLGAFHGPPLGPFPRSHDLFGDGSVLLVELDGHAKGQTGAIVRNNDGQRVFLLADAFWTRTEIEQNLKPTASFRLVADDWAAVLRTRNRVREFLLQNPDVQPVCCHCPDFAEEMKFNVD